MKKLSASILLSLSIAAHAEPPKTLQQACESEMPIPLATLYSQYTRGVHGAILDYLIRTDKAWGNYGKWILVKSLTLLELADAHGQLPNEPGFVGVVINLCQLEASEITVPMSDNTVDNFDKYDHNI